MGKSNDYRSEYHSEILIHIRGICTGEGRGFHHVELEELVNQRKLLKISIIGW